MILEMPLQVRLILNLPNNQILMSDANKIGEALKGLHGEGSGRDTVLCVDDNEMIRNMLGRVARMVARGLNVELAEGYDDAISKVSGKFRGRIAVVITDTEMPPGKNGMELAKALKGEDASPEVLEDMQTVPIVINSGNYDYSSPFNDKGAAMKALLDSGTANVFLEKPFMPDDLREAVMTAVDRVKTRSN